MKLFDCVIMDCTRISLPYKVRHRILALGAQTKSSFCLVKDDEAYLWRPGGDLNSLENLKLFEDKIKKAEKRFKIKPEVITCDLHPDYISTKLAYKWGEEQGLKVKSVQHHKAHIASCIVDNNIKGKVIGIAFDGTGFGPDGNIWGGEFFVGTLRDLRRAGHLRYIPMPGGEGCIREPWRMALSYLYDICKTRFSRLKIAFLSRIDKEKTRLLTQIIDKDINSPMTSSMGRLFDAVSAIAGICEVAGYEGQAAIELEKALDARCSMLNARKRYSFKYRDKGEVIIIDWSPLIKGLVKDSEGKKGKAEISLKFHNAVSYMIKEVCVLLRKRYGIEKVSISGGVFQNRYLTKVTPPLLEKEGFRVYLHKNLPAHDGNIALGQAAIAAQGSAFV